MKNDDIYLLKRYPKKGIEKIMDQYTPLLIYVVSNTIGNMGTKEDIEDIVSETFTAIYEQRDFIDSDKGSLKNYICLVAKRKTIDFLRKQKDITMEEETIEDSIESVIKRADLLNYISRLGKKQRKILLMKYYEDKSSKSIADILGMKVNTVDKNIQRGLSKLKSMMEVYYG